MLNLIQISELSICYGEIPCFNDFNYTIYPYEKIAIIGDNGTGKSSLLKLLAQVNDISHEGNINLSEEITIGYVPQIITEYNDLSGGQRFNKALTQALASNPMLLLLDEPTNHLDRNNRKSLIRLLQNYPAAQIIVSHDVEMLDNCVDTLWHIHDGHIDIFTGKYSIYRERLKKEKQKLLAHIAQLKQAKQQQHIALMHEQQRAKSSRSQGEKNIEQRKWPTITSKAKARRAETTSGKKLAQLNEAKDTLVNQLSELWQPEELGYSFNLTTNKTNKPILTINDGKCGYLGGEDILRHINLNLFGKSKTALLGANGSGKSTLVKAIMHDSTVKTSGEWIIPQPHDIAILDQHYSNLPNSKTIIDYINDLNTSFTHSELRAFLNQFLFRKNHEVNNLISNLSGGEKARLSLAAIALTNPSLLILDEITNNIDLTTREHIIQILDSYPGAMLVISHDADFLQAIHIEEYYEVSTWHS